MTENIRYAVAQYLARRKLTHYTCYRLSEAADNAVFPDREDFYSLAAFITASTSSGFIVGILITRTLTPSFSRTFAASSES
jgi:hypothetical protein